jgi:Flp pilus assembly protein TadG
MIRAYYQRFAASLKRLAHAQHGSALPIVGLAMMAILGSAGVAVDMGRVQIVQARMQNSIDAAGLAAGSVISTENPSAQVNKYFNANFPQGYMGSTITSLTAITNEDNTKLDINVSGKVPTTFMKIFGIDEVDIGASSQITRAQRGLELVLVIDVTGSMNSSAGNGQTRLQAAKSASISLLNILYGAENTNDNLWVALVPFSQAVNVGKNHEDWTSDSSWMHWGPTEWEGCVDAREANGRDTTDDPPSTALFPKYYWPCDGNNSWYGTNSSKNNCSTGWGMQYRTPLTTTNRGPNLYCPQALTPLVAEKSTLVNSINSMQAYGNTHVGLGAVWAWRLLSPRWRGLWGGQMDDNNLPLDYDAPLMNKAVIIMTDGDNTHSNGSHTAYWYLKDGKLGTTNSNAAVTQLNNRTTDVCSRMKANGIIVYTIAFGTSFSWASRNMLSGCASKPEFYFESPSGNDLQTAFKKIGDSLANLRVSQ